MGEMFHYIFDGIRDRFQHELMLISQQYPFEPLQYQRPPLRLSYDEGIALLQVASWLVSVLRLPHMLLFVFT
jgi:aspartyl-tRNA synthetase